MGDLPKMPKDRTSERGVALLITLLAMALLTIVVMQFTFETQVAYRKTTGWLSARRAHLLAESGIDMAAEILVRYRHGALLNRILQQAANVTLPVPVPDGMGSLHLRIDDLNARLDWNQLASHGFDNRPLVRRTREVTLARFQHLMDLIGLDPALPGPVMDWVDRDHNVRLAPLGAEQTHYDDLEPPYLVRNGLLRSFGELALVKDIGRAELATLRPVSSVVRGRYKELALPTPDALADRAKVNINTAPIAVLRAMLRAHNPGLDDETLARRIHAERQIEPFSDIASVRAVEGISALGARAVDSLFRFDSVDFRVRATGEFDGVLQSVEAVLHRQGTHIRLKYWLPRRGPNVPDAGNSGALWLDAANPGGIEPSE